VAELSPLEKLRDIQLPKPISCWPLAPGWYVLALVGLLFFILLIYFIYRKHLQARAKRQALQLLKDYEQYYQAGGEIQVISAQISELLRRVALVYFPREQVASLSGEAWINFLNNTSKQCNFTALSDCLLTLPYQEKAPNINLNPLFENARKWIKNRGAPCSN
jgi:cbb3-type cytochrome oxidase subunit 3